MNKIDLIFQKQPEEVQKKLMELLIHYNAILQYNSSTDTFEVDMLLPFQQEEQKRLFLQQYHRIREQSRKMENSQKIIESQQTNVSHLYQNQKKKQYNSQQSSFNARDIMDSNQIRINQIIKQEKQSQFQNLRRQMQERQKEKQKQKEKQRKKSKKIDFNNVERILDEKINQSIKIITNIRRSKINLNQRIQNDQSKIHNQEIPPRKEEKQIYQTPRRYQQQQINPYKSNSNSILIEGDDYSNQNLSGYSSYNRSSPYEVNNAIQQKMEEDEDELFPDTKNKNSVKNEQKNKLKQQKFKKQSASPARFHRNKYSSFFESNRKNFEKIYEDIKRDMYKSQKDSKYSLIPQNTIKIQQEKDYPQEKQFKEEIMKEYQKKVVVVNEALSSEDLVKYFKYLLRNARTLYLNYLKNKTSIKK